MFSIKESMLQAQDFRTNYRSVVLMGKPESIGSPFPVLNSIGKIKIRLLIVGALALFGLFATQLVFATNLSTDGQVLASVQSQISSLQSENANLKAQIAKVSSFTTLSQKARELGFTSEPKIITP